MSARSIVIVGGGIIGSSTTYFLTRHPKFGPEVKVHLVEACYIAAGASGKGGGFMAKDWHTGPTTSLAALSFDLHQQLADEYNGEQRWGYRRLTTLQINIDGTKKRTKRVPGVDWIDGVTHSQPIGSTSTSAQVTPGPLTNSLVELAQEKGAEVTIATVDGVEFSEDQARPVAVLATDEAGNRKRIPATDVVFTAGPWTASLAQKLLGHRAGAALDVQPSPCSTSVIFRPTIEVSAHALFIELNTPTGEAVSPEIYPRPDGTLYMSGDHTDPMRQRALTAKATDATPSEIAVKNHKDRLEFLSEKFKDASIEVTQACFRPESKRNRPIVGKLGEGLWIASGHSVWGICNGPGTGKVMAELLLDGVATSADIRSLRP